MRSLAARPAATRSTYDRSSGTGPDEQPVKTTPRSAATRPALVARSATEISITLTKNIPSLGRRCLGEPPARGNRVHGRDLEGPAQRGQERPQGVALARRGQRASRCHLHALGGVV